MLFYDMAITFSDEVEKIWKQRFTGATVLWFMVRSPNAPVVTPHTMLSVIRSFQNRYLSPLGYIIIIVC